MKIFRPFRYAWLLAGAVFCLFIAIISEQWLPRVLTDISFRSRVRAAQRAVYEKDTLSDTLLKKLAEYSDNPDHKASTYLYHASEHHSIFLYIIERGVVTYWTTNNTLPAIETGMSLSGRDFHTERYSNGLFLQKNISYQGKILVALLPVQYSYSIQNRYLQRHVVITNDDDRLLTAYDKPAANSVSITGNDGAFLFSLVQSGSIDAWWKVSFYLLGITLLALFFHLYIRLFLQRRMIIPAFGVLLLFLAVFTLFWKVWQLPADLFTGGLFSPQYYASPVFFSSLGDLLLTTVIACYLGWFLNAVLRQEPLQKVNRWVSFFAMSVLFILVFVMLGYITRSLILDSQLSMNLSNIFGLNIYSIIGLVILFGWLGLAFILVRKYTVWLRRNFSGFKKLWLPWVAIVAVSSALLVMKDVSFILALALAVAGVVSTLLLMRSRQNNAIARAIVYLVLGCVFLTVLFAWYQRIKETESKKVVARQLAIQRDNVAEYLFDNVYKQISRDPYLANFYLNPAVARSFLEKRIRQLYFSGYLNKYDIALSSYTADGRPFKMDYEQPLEYYQDYLQKNTTVVRPGTLYYLETYTGLPGYIAILPVQREGYMLGILLIRIQRKAFYEESIYPALLLSEGLEGEEDAKFDYAVYRKGILLTQKGTYPYSGAADFKFKKDSLGYGHFSANGYRHLVYRISDEITVVLSSRSYSILTYFSNFSFLVLFFALCGVVFFALPYLAVKFWQKSLWKYPITTVFRNLWSRFSFRFKILATVTGGISLALFLIGLATIGYIVYQYNYDELERLNRRTRLINTGLENAFEETDPSVPLGEEELTMILKRLSDLRLLDINVYDPYGNLAATTQSALFENQLVVPKMNAGAFHLFRDHHASQVLHDEQIGSLHFIASYRPIRNPLGDIIGYLNIPYFMQEQELTNRISTFLVALINLYLLLFVLLISLSIIIARALTEPLDLIRHHLRRTSLNANDQFLVWHNKDEIGKLVEEYNAALAALKESAARLSRSEREGAWKEIAQRVAHEISNPLTPMKLNIQRLQQAFAEGREDIQPLFDKVTNLLIRQIDTLSELAANFGEYAKLPLGRPEPIQPASIIRNTAELFSSPDMEISFDLDDEDAMVFIDKNHCTQVLNNLVKNAVQAIPEGRHGLIHIRMHADPNWVYLEVHDNGTGIPEEMQEKIFIPHFSTKSFGTGQGLAITREMIEFAGGHISFVTRAGEGTTFFVRLPRYKAPMPVTNPGG
jgi:signal transduction histidine kinase